MTENENNRRWLIANRLADKKAQETAARDEAETLLYYQRQLESELEYVRRRLVEVTRA